MRKVTQSLFILFAFIGLLACGGDVPIPSKITLKVGPGYESGNDYATLNQSITVGIIATKLETSDVLRTFEVSVLYDDSTTPISYYKQTLTGTDGDVFNKDIQFTTRNQAGTEKWIFSVTNNDGLTKQIYILLAVS